MSKNQNLINFKPAQLYIGKEWFVAYYVLNPATEKLDRKKIKLNTIKLITERRKFANQLILDLNRKLYSGWNPYQEENAPRGFTKLNDALDIYLKLKTKELREDSQRTYNSFVLTFKKWLDLRGKNEMFSANFNRMDALEFLDDKYAEGISNLTYNNYKAFFTIIWNWMVEHKYAATNPFTEIRKKSKEQKLRILIDEKTRKEIIDHLLVEDYNFAVVCMLVFHTLLRPKEITHLKPNSFNIKNQTIFLPGSGAKNKHDRIITIPNAFIPFLVEWNWNNALNNEFIFGDQLRPGNKPGCSRLFAKKWVKVRKEIGLTEDQKLYSLRDSGIIQMLNDGISPEEVMKQADHSSLEMTTIYAKHANPKGSQQIKSSSSGFSGNKKTVI